jgi:hypothetical protein
MTFWPRLWRELFKLPIDSMPKTGRHLYESLRNHFLNSASWDGVYDLVEFVALHGSESKAFTATCNVILEREVSGYRFVGSRLVAITSPEELADVQRAMWLPDPFASAKAHITAATNHFSNRKSPDYRNSIKESISAVEAMCKIITGENGATLGQALKKLEANGIPLHGSLRESFSKLYGYTNDAQGIRHGLGLTEEPDLGFDDAKFMLVSCSAFVNYLAAKAAKAGVVGGK